MLSVLVEDAAHQPVSSEAYLQKWIDVFGITYTVLADDDYLVWDQYGQGPFPTVLVIDRDMNITYKGASASEAVLEAEITGLL